MRLMRGIHAGSFAGGVVKMIFSGETLPFVFGTKIAGKMCVNGAACGRNQINE